jgi:hypothetical protein
MSKTKHNVELSLSAIQVTRIVQAEIELGSSLLDELTHRR